MGLIKPKDNGGTCPGGWWIGGFNFGLEHTVVQVEGEKYLGRWIIYIAGLSFRLHKFYRGDDMRAPHDHPWGFITFPLCHGYWEWTLDDGGRLKSNWVRGWMPHYRPATYTHIVDDPDRPFWTIVVTARKSHSWGFWPVIGETAIGIARQFIHWTDWE